MDCHGQVSTNMSADVASPDESSEKNPVEIPLLLCSQLAVSYPANLPPLPEPPLDKHVTPSSLGTSLEEK